MVRASAIKRFNEAEKWEMQAIMEMQGTSQRPNLGKPGLNIPIQIRREPEVPVDMEERRPGQPGAKGRQRGHI